MNWKLAGIGIVVLVAALGLGRWWFAATHYPTLPDFSMPDISGTLHGPDEWQGEVLVLNFWATWCKPCRKEIPMLVSIQSDLGDQGLQIVGVAIDKPEPVKRFAEEFAINYPVLVDALGASRLQDALTGGDGIPFTVVVDRQGRIRHQVAGTLAREQLLDMVKPLLQKG